MRCSGCLGAGRRLPRSGWESNSSGNPRPPRAWALVIWSVLALLVVTVYLPMAWDRYQLPIQAPAALLAALLLASAATALERGSPSFARGTDAIALATRVEWSVFVLLLGSYAFFWHSRDWNTASRLILTYAMADRGTVCLDGLDRQTGDIAFFQGHYYCDKLPGFSLLAMAPYRLARAVLGSSRPPIEIRRPRTTGRPITGSRWALRDCSRPSRRYYWCGSRATWAARRAARARGTGLWTGHASLCLRDARVWSSALRVRADRLVLLAFQASRRQQAARLVAAGFLAAYARGHRASGRPSLGHSGALSYWFNAWDGRGPDALAYFAIGAAVTTLVLLAYNMLAFGSPWEMGYFHHATAQFAKVHNRQNPLGLRPPDPTLVIPLLWGEYRGLLFYAPDPCPRLSPAGCCLPCAGDSTWRPCRLAIAAAVFVVNLSYPEWTGGWSTGPRLLVPLCPLP